MKPSIEIIRFLNGEIPEDNLLELVPERHDLITGFREVYLALAEGQRAKVAHCAVCGTLLLRRRVLTGRPNYCEAERCRKIMKLGRDRPVTLDSVPEPTRSCYREIQAYNGGYSD